VACLRFGSRQPNGRRYTNTPLATRAQTTKLPELGNLSFAGDRALAKDYGNRIIFSVGTLLGHYGKNISPRSRGTRDRHPTAHRIHTCGNVRDLVRSCKRASEIWFKRIVYRCGRLYSLSRIVGGRCAARAKVRR